MKLFEQFIECSSLVNDSGVLYYICKLDKDKNLGDQRHLAFGSSKLRLVTSVAECAKRYSWRHGGKRDRNIVRQGQNRRATIFGYTAPNTPHYFDPRYVNNSLIITFSIKIYILLGLHIKVWTLDEFLVSISMH